VITVHEAILALAKKRPVFHSEADFQHALAWEIHQVLPAASVRLELPIQVGSHLFHVDTWVEHQGAVMAIELKYKTRALSVRVGTEQFTLKNQSAQDIGRYDFLKDVQRLEQIVGDRQNCDGYAVLLTNDSAYWTNSPSGNTVDADFRIHDGRRLDGMLRWDANASVGTMKDREQPIVLRDRYMIKWVAYSKPSPSSYGDFRFAVLRISRNQAAG
jgi:hypothetical protein